MAVPEPDALREALRTAELDVAGRLVSASNTTLLCTLDLGGELVRCVYKPEAGERPLWDFPNGTLGRREVATAMLAEHWAELTGTEALVPTTVWREDGPFGPGMCQRWVEDAEGGGDVDVVASGEVPAGWLVSVDGVDGSHREVSVVHADRPDLRSLSLFDVLVNNADRKGGHILRDPQGRLYAIDHGVTFHVEDKLRSVLWGWGGNDLDAAELSLLDELAGQLEHGFGRALAQWVDEDEVAAVGWRARGLRRRGRFPLPSGVWPAIPWPLF